MAGKIVRSAKGALVDFDLLQIKEKMASAPKPVTVQTREDFVDKKFKRRLNRQTREAIDLANEDSTLLTPEQTTDPVPTVKEGIKALKPKTDKTEE